MPRPLSLAAPASTLTPPEVTSRAAAQWTGVPVRVPTTIIPPLTGAVELTRTVRWGVPLAGVGSPALQAATAALLSGDQRSPQSRAAYRRSLASAGLPVCSLTGRRGSALRRLRTEVRRLAWIEVGDLGLSQPATLLAYTWVLGLSGYATLATLGQSGTPADLAGRLRRACGEIRDTPWWSQRARAVAEAPSYLPAAYAHLAAALTAAHTELPDRIPAGALPQ